MLNNKGQVLVLFVLLIPIILVVLVMVVDIGNLSYQKNSLNNICNLTLDYISEENNIEKIKEYVKLNDKNIDNIEIKNDKLILKKRVDGLLSHVINIDIFDIEVSCNIERNN